MKKIISALILASLAIAYATAEYGMMLRVKEPSLKSKTEKGYTWATTIPYGTKVELKSTDCEKGLYYWQGGSQKDVEFYAVKYNGKDYYAKKDELAVGGIFGVVSENATLFTKPKISAFRNAILETGSLILLTGNTKKFGKAEFAEIEFYDESAAKLKTRWIQTSKYSDRENDVKAAQLVEISKTRKDENLKKEDLSDALNINTTTKISEYVQSVYNKAFGIETESSLEEAAMEAATEAASMIEGASSTESDNTSGYTSMSDLVGNSNQ